MKHKIIIIGIVILAALACGFAVWELQKSSTGSTETPAAKVDPALLMQLQTDMRGITPHLVDARKANGQVLTTQEQKIKDDVIALMLAGEPTGAEFYSQLWLEAIGTRYILATQPIADSSYDEAIDSQTGSIMRLPGDLAFSIASRNMEVYIAQQAIYAYTLDQASAVLVAGSQLAGTETYNSAEADFSDLYAHQSHTDSSITITVYDTSKRVPNPALGEGATMNGKVREATYSF